jgi:hypothetical protein
MIYPPDFPKFYQLKISSLQELFSSMKGTTDKYTVRSEVLIAV